MRLRALILLMAPLVLLGADQKKSPAKAAAKPAAKPAPAKPKPAPPAIPPEAKEVEPNVFRHTDEQGRTWTYHKTPFGVLKGEYKPEDPETADEIPGLKVVEDGEELRFERPSPFGPMRWTRKKTELTPAEQKAWERMQKAKAAQPEQE